jgi:hypothetical protein
MLDSASWSLEIAFQESEAEHLQEFSKSSHCTPTPSLPPCSFEQRNKKNRMKMKEIVLLHQKNNKNLIEKYLHNGLGKKCTQMNVLGDQNRSSKDMSIS